MNKCELQNSITQYNDQLAQVDQALNSTTDASERESLLSLQSDLQQLLALTHESLSVVAPACDAAPSAPEINGVKSGSVIDDEYALFMMEMADSGAYNDGDKSKSDAATKPESDDGSDLEDELQSLPGTKCGVYHMHAWGGQPTLHNAMVASVERSSDRLHDLQVRVLFTHPTHAEMLPCPFFLDGDCKFSDQQCRYSHGEVFSFSNLQEAIEPNFESLRLGSRVLVKLKPPDGEDITLTKKSAEKYHLWHRSVVKSINIENKTCHVKLEQGANIGEKRKATDDFQVAFEELFPLNDASPSSSESEDSLSDTEYPDAKQQAVDNKDLLVERSLQRNGPAMGEWERHTRGIGSKLMLAMGYVAGTGLGAAADGRVEPVPARVLPAGKSLDHCMQSDPVRDPLQVEKKLKRLQKKEEERNKRLEEREQERERRNVFNFLNKTLGDQPPPPPPPSAAEARSSIRQSTSKCLNIERFKITEDVKRVERDLLKLKNTLYRHSQGSNIHKNISAQVSEKTRELDSLRSREMEISREQSDRKDKQKLTLF